MLNLAFDPHQFAGKPNRSVSAETGISFQDYSFMQTYTRKDSGERRLPTPRWAVDDLELRELLCRFMERRLRIPAEGSLEQRRARIALAIEAERPRITALLDRMNLEYVRARHDSTPRERLKKLEQEIESLDTYIRTGSMAFVAAVVFLYYRAVWIPSAWPGSLD